MDMANKNDDNQTGMRRGQQGRGRRVTASDVANVARVSRSAVSRAFTPGAYLDKDKRALILKTARQLGYRPNALAASLHGSSTNLVGVVAGSLDNLYDSEFLAKLVAELNQANKWPLVLAGGDSCIEDSILSILNYPLDALIIRGGSIPSSLIETCAKLNIPLLFSGHVVDAPFTDCVCCRNGAGAALAVDHLVERGRTAFGFLGGPSSRSSSLERLEGTEERLKHHGLELQIRHFCDYSYENGRKAAKEMLAQAKLDALLCANDAMALGALSAIRATLGLKVPDDLSIIGFDDVALAAWPDFNLTTLRNPIDQTVAEILRLLELRLDSPDKPNEVVLVDPVLMRRGTD
ncbi:LacI family DNA-binding transcriptional regulator [Cohaesibacter intestini]|uniref:LacI family DNA-binding transcriptional regulator n=1 Tax=Cohaesibacter intestini TaxID=2211145 RepID=UPI0018E5075B|nr:LacI family DNA-binding transcriptional regulator [Cohaesibacter intestini]